MSQTELRKLPAIDALLKDNHLSDLATDHGRQLVLDAARQELENVRQHILGEQASAPSLDQLSQAVVERVLGQIEPTLHPVINATAVIIHTNLGRALLSQQAQQAMVEAASSYNNLEYDLEAGQRGSRYRHAEALLCRLSGAEAALVVNNNASALVLCLSALAKGKSVLISRSQLIEIGGGFRIPDIMTQSGAHLVEVGTTNRTYVRDYENYLQPDETSLILRVHASNYKIIGFTSEPSLADLVGLGRQHGIPVMDDLGSGTLLDTTPYGLAHEPTIQESVAAGAEVITASGDKLLGGPQAGLIFGKAEIIQQLKKHPLTRALRVDKITLAALQATLRAYLENKAPSEIPVWQMISADKAALTRRAKRWLRLLNLDRTQASLIDTHSTVGGGSLPGQQMPTCALALHVASPSTLAAQLRFSNPRVIARIEADQLILDPRTVLPSQDKALVAALKSTIESNV